MISIRLCGAAGEVTGSGYLVETPASRILVDFGIFQGGADSHEARSAPSDRTASTQSCSRTRTSTTRDGCRC